MSPQWKFITWYGDLSKRFGASELIGRLAAILILNRGHEVSLQELADKSEYSLSAVSQTIDSFVKMGLAERRKKKGDRRAFFYMKQDFAEILRSFLELVLQEEVQSGMKMLNAELRDIESELGYANGERKEELLENRAIVEGLIKEMGSAEHYLQKLLAVELPESQT
ncbi:MAG: MarR family transcriptional regulator [Candidatus Thorarchaeota archaeon]